MILNNQYRCPVCGSIINVRIPVGYIKSTYIYISCPKCLTEAKMHFTVDNETIQLKFELLENAEKIESRKYGYYDYSIEASPEFPSIVDPYCTPEKYATPFIRTVSKLNSFEKNINEIITSLIRYQEKKEEISIYTRLFSYYKNNKMNFLEQEMDKIFGKSNDDTEQRFLSILSDYFSEFTNYKAHIIVNSNIYRTLNSIKKNNSEFSLVAQMISKDNQVEIQLKKVIMKLLNFIHEFEMFYPIICTRYFKEGQINDDFFVKNYVVTASLSKLKILYKELYEIIMKATNIMFALHGLKNFSIDQIKIENIDIEKILNGKFCSNGKKLKEFSKYDIDKILPNSNMLDNSLRNGFEHEDDEYSNADKVVEIGGKLFYPQSKIAYFDLKLYDTLLFVFEYLVLVKYHFNNV